VTESFGVEVVGMRWSIEWRLCSLVDVIECQFFAPNRHRLSELTHDNYFKSLLHLVQGCHTGRPEANGQA
jgi:hypothetical protein